MQHSITADNIKIHYKIDHAQQVKAKALLLHGFGEHIGRYDEFVSTLNRWGISVLRFDFRGHGHSTGLRGHVMRFQDYLADLKCVLELFEKKLISNKRILLAHSNGALIATHALHHLPNLNTWEAVVFSSPFFALRVKVPWWKHIIAYTLSQFVPRLRLSTGSNSHLLSHDPYIKTVMDRDHLIVYQASVRWFTETLSALKEIPQLLQDNQIRMAPTLWQVAGDDFIVNAECTYRYYTKFKSPYMELISYADSYHELWFEEPMRRVVIMNDLRLFLEDLIS